MWDTFLGKLIRRIDSPEGTVTSLAFAPNGRLLASGTEKSTILLWDLASLAKPNTAKASLAAAALDKVWSLLIGDAAEDADRAIWALAAAPKQGLPFLKEKALVKPAAQEEVAALIADLDSSTLVIRQKAASALLKLGEAAESQVRFVLAGTLPLEQRQRVEQIVEQYDKAAIGKLRALEVLELIGTLEARQILHTLVKESPNPRVAEAARGALERAGNRPGDSIFETTHSIA